MSTTVHEGSNQTTISIFLIIAGAAAILFAVAYYGHFYGTNTDTDTPEAVVQEFGTHMKNVSLLASKDIVEEAMDTEYGPYVTIETLMAWKADPAHAPGRLTSSPWPSRIEVATGTPEGNEYRLTGYVVEETSDTAVTGEASGYPVVVTLTKEDGGWKIQTFTRTLPDNLPVGGAPPEIDVLTGIYECLPHKDQTGPQTMECAFGIKTDDGAHYALDFSAFTSEAGMTIATGERIRAEGTLVPLAALNATDDRRIYDIQGVLKVSNLTAL